jgi:hypothetical protein
MLLNEVLNRPESVDYLNNDLAADFRFEPFQQCVRVTRISTGEVAYGTTKEEALDQFDWLDFLIAYGD